MSVCNLIITSPFDTAQESHCQLLAIVEFRDELCLRCLHLQAEMDTVLKFTKRPTDGQKPTQLAFYPARWKSFLEDAKGECRAQHAIENPFPNLVEDLTGSITESLTTVLVKWNRDGKQFESGELLVF